jgi:RNA polymerase sigma-70 factor (ECF subfamily)
MRAGNDDATMLPAKRASDDIADEVLASLAAGGRTAAHTAIWDRYAPHVRSIVRRSIRIESDVEDLVQEVFLQFYRSHTLLRDREALRAYICAIAYHVTIRELRFRSARKRTALDTEALRWSIPPADFEAREAIAGVRAALDQLDPIDRRAFVLRHVDGLELAEIAAVLEMSLATVKRRLAKVGRRVNAMTKKDRRLGEDRAER